MANQSETHELEQNDVALPETGRPVIHAFQGVISSGHYLTSMAGIDRKSTRLNSSHKPISYAVFCLKKKTKKHEHNDWLKTQLRINTNL